MPLLNPPVSTFLWVPCTLSRVILKSSLFIWKNIFLASINTMSIAAQTQPRSYNYYSRFYSLFLCIDLVSYLARRSMQCNSYDCSYFVILNSVLIEFEWSPINHVKFLVLSGELGKNFLVHERTHPPKFHLSKKCDDSAETHLKFEKLFQRHKRVDQKHQKQDAEF